jgi:hypothetical protein
MEERTREEEEEEDAKRSLRQYFASFLDSNIHEFNKYRYSDEMTTIKVRYDVLGGITKIFKVRKYTIYNTPTLFGEIKKIFVPPPLWNEFKIITMDNKLIPDSNPLTPDVIIITEKSDTDHSKKNKRKNDDSNTASSSSFKKSRKRIDDDSMEEDYGKMKKTSHHEIKSNKKKVTFAQKNTVQKIEKDRSKALSEDVVLALRLPPCHFDDEPNTYPCSYKFTYFTSEEDMNTYLDLIKNKKENRIKHYKNIHKKLNSPFQRAIMKLRQTNDGKKKVMFDIDKNTSIDIERDPLKSKSPDYIYAKTLPNCNYKDISFPCKISKSYFASLEDYQEYLSLKKLKKGKKSRRKHYKKISKKFNIVVRKKSKKTKLLNQVIPPQKKSEKNKLVS